MAEELCSKCGSRLSRSAQRCLKCGALRPLPAPATAGADDQRPARPDARRGDPLRESAERTPAPRQSETIAPWADTTEPAKREYGAPEPQRASRASGLKAVATGEVTWVAEVRPELVWRQLLVVLAPPWFASFREEVRVLPFRVSEPDGRVVECLLRGRLRGGTVQLGDSVEASGAWLRRGDATLDVRRVRNLTTGAILTARLPFGALRRDRLRWLLLVPAILLALVILTVRACGR